MEEGTTIRKHGSILLESILGENPSLVSIPFLSRVRFYDPVRMKGKRREEILKRTHDIWLLGPCVEKRREWKTRLASLRRY